MIIRRLRHASPYLISLGLLMGGSTALIGQATQAAIEPHVTRAELYATIGGAGAVIFGALWVLLRAQNADMKGDLHGAVARLEGAVALYFDALRAHDDNPHAHCTASEHNHAPMERKMDHLAERFDALVEECRVNRCAVGHRDPANSPHPRRDGDPDTFDGRGLRGRQ